MHTLTTGYLGPDQQAKLTLDQRYNNFDIAKVLGIDKELFDDTIAFCHNNFTGNLLDIGEIKLRLEKYFAQSNLPIKKAASWYLYGTAIAVIYTINLQSGTTPFGDYTKLVGTSFVGVGILTMLGSVYFSKDFADLVDKVVTKSQIEQIEDDLKLSLEAHGMDYMLKAMFVEHILHVATFFTNPKLSHAKKQKLIAEFPSRIKTLLESMPTISAEHHEAMQKALKYFIDSLQSMKEEVFSYECRNIPRSPYIEMLLPLAPRYGFDIYRSDFLVAIDEAIEIVTAYQINFQKDLPELERGDENIEHVEIPDRQRLIGTDSPGFINWVENEGLTLSLA